MLFGVVPVWFIIAFLLFLVGFGSLISYSMRKLSGNIASKLFGLIEGILIAGIIGGVICMFQPWSLTLYGLGFHILLVCVLSFTLWSHITPKQQVGSA
jgi:hypothetical protein